MILIDANILLYAYDASSDRHERARIWLEKALSGIEQIRLAWVTILAFLRIGTNPRAFGYPLTTHEATAAVSAWLGQPGVSVLEPGERHWSIFKDLLAVTQSRGPAVTDAHIAALAVEHGAVLQTTDRDFVRFPGLKTVNPLEG